MAKKTKTSKKPAVDSGDSSIKQIIFTLIGSTPMIILAWCCYYIVNKESIARGNRSFWAKGRLHGMIDPYEHYEEVECGANDYTKDRFDFKECAPKKCARMFTDHVITDDEVEFLLKLSQKGFSQGGGSGGASIFDIHSGVVSMKQQFMSLRKVYKEQKKDLFTPAEIETFNEIKEKIIKTIKEKFAIDKVYLTKPVFFSEITDKKAQTMHDEYWHEHIDKKQYEGFHYTTLIYLNTHQQNFMGGRFFWVNEKDNSTLSFQPRRGRLSVFSSGSENAHYVEKVLSGTRYAMTIPFTCNEKLAISIE